MLKTVHRGWAAAVGCALILACASAWLQRAGRRGALPQHELRIGADHAPPYHFLKPGDPPEGLAVDVMNEAARRAGVRLRWQPLDMMPDEALRRDLVDLWPALAPTPWRRQNFYLTAPWLSNNFTLVSLVSNGDIRSNQGRGRTVAFRNGAYLHELASKRLPQAALLPTRSREESFTLMCTGKIDAAMVEARFLDTALLDRPPGCAEARLRVQSVPETTSDLRLTAKKEYRLAADAMHQAILEMASDGSLAAILEKWSAFSSVEARSVYALQEAERRNKLFQYSLWVLAVFAVALASLAMHAFRTRRRSRDAQKAAEKANAAKSEFLANMSHEIRTPLSGVIGMARLVLDGSITEDRRQDIETIENSAESLLAIVNDVLDLSKIEAGQLRLEHEAFDLERAIRLVIDLLRPRLKEKGLGFNLSYDEHVPRWIWGDETRVRQIVLNLVGNAVKFTDQGAVLVSVRSSGKSRLLIEVADTGIGIPEAQRDRLFQKFSQADTSMTRRYGGTGLGLVISKELAELMGGQIGFNSRAGEGSTFWVAIPAEPASEPAVEPPHSTLSAYTALGRGKVLVVEDNAVNQRVLLRSLQKLGLEVDVASNGSEAVARSRTSSYDLVFMDCQMPEMDGYEATARIRAAERNGKRTPIVALTAHAMPGDRARCEAAGMDDYLSKPVDLGALEHVLRRYVAAERGPAGTPQGTSAG
jgi:signal transduction histidine kinase/ActR/RegA family two-component response regulator